MLSSSCDSEVEFYMHINIEAGWHARSFNTAGDARSLNTAGHAFQGREYSIWATNR